MKIKAIIGFVALSLSGVAFAGSDYYPPERVHCQSDESARMICSDFNRQYLIEATHTADLPQGKEFVFYFSSGTAYQTLHDEWAVFYTYKDNSGKNVRFKTVNDKIHPNLATGSWKQSKDIFTCSAGYMSCPITNLPAHS